jgi:hypothetical protein
MWFTRFIPCKKAFETGFWNFHLHDYEVKKEYFTDELNKEIKIISRNNSVELQQKYSYIRSLHHKICLKIILRCVEFAAIN